MPSTWLTNSKVYSAFVIQVQILPEKYRQSALSYWNRRGNYKPNKVEYIKLNATTTSSKPKETPIPEPDRWGNKGTELSRIITDATASKKKIVLKPLTGVQAECPKPRLSPEQKEIISEINALCNNLYRDYQYKF